MITRRWLWALAALAVAATGACTDDDAGPTSVAGGKNAVFVNMDFATVNPPTGDAVVPIGPVAQLDTATYPTDLFGRGAPDRNPWFIQSGDLDIDATMINALTAPRWWFLEGRLPRLQEHRAWESDGSSVNGNIDYLEFQRPDRSSRIDRWDAPADIDWVGNDDSWYAVGLARYGVKVNGLVDHLENLVNDGNLLEPDSLILLGGSPGGYPDHQADFGLIGSAQPPDDYCPPYVAGANPFILGHFKTGPTVDPKDAGADGIGETDYDFCFLGNGSWQSGYVDPLDPDSVPFAPNNFETFDLPQYNYWVVWEYDRATNTVHYDKPYMRAQVGIDIDYQTEQPVPHGFAPFPVAPGEEYNEWSDFDSYEEFLADPRVTPGVTSLDMIVYNLKPLTSGSAYQTWLYDEVGTNAPVRVSPTYTLQRPDTTGVDELGNPIIEWVDEAAPAVVNEFNGAMGYRHVIELRTADIGVDMALYSHAAVTIGSGGDASPAASPNPTCYRYTDKQETDDAADRLISVSGAMTPFCTGLATGGDHWALFGGTNIHFLADTAVALGINRLARPPLGYYYAVWLMNEADGTQYGLGEITTPPADDFQSLRDADVAPNDGVYLTDTEIFEAAKYFLWADVPSSYQAECIGLQEGGGCTVLVTLEPKSGDESIMGETVIAAGIVPKQLDSERLRETESR